MASYQRRQVARVMIVDETGAVLLFSGSEAARQETGPWWFMPGGGLKAGESFEDAARREVREETGYDIGVPGPLVLRKEVEFEFIDSVARADEAYFVVRTKRFEVSTDGWTDRERSYVIGHRWWTPQALCASSHAFYPNDLPDIVATYG